MASVPQARPRPVVLCILDGWGHRQEREGNAIALANTPNWDRMIGAYPHTLLETSGLEVGLPKGQMGNSEVGHVNLGAGRVVMQDLPRIDRAIEDGSLAANPILAEMIGRLRDSGGTLHLLGLVSPGGVHSHQDHIAAMARIVDLAEIPVKVHAFLDGRDTPPSSAKDYVARLEADLAGTDVEIATISGRYYAMDRDNRWDRVRRAFEALVLAEGERAATAIQAIEQSYRAGQTDEFVLPTIIGDYAGMKDGDGLFMANFRADRAREILHALVDPAFSGFERLRVPAFSARIGMSEYASDLNPYLQTLFPSEPLTHIFGEIIADAALTQLRIAETEKYAHVTFFFNGGEERAFPGEERILVPSPKVATYDLKPEMSAVEVTDKLVAAIESGHFDVIVANYANGDMVGHTGILPAAIKAAETIDACLGRLEQAVTTAGGTMLITADHGNAEQMLDPETGQVHTAHSTGPVPAVLVNPPAGIRGLEHGRLADVAPTLLALLHLPQPSEMTGHSLIRPAAASDMGRRAAG